MPKFKDPKTGQVVNVNYFLVFLSSFLFGMFFFLYIGETQHALVMVGFAILIALVGIFLDPIFILFGYIFPLIYSFIAPKIVKDKWLNKGFIESQEHSKPNKEYINLEAVPKIKQGLGFFALAIDATLIYNFSVTFSYDIKLFILRLLLTIVITVGVWLLICYIVDRVHGVT